MLTVQVCIHMYNIIIIIKISKNNQEKKAYLFIIDFNNFAKTMGKSSGSSIEIRESDTRPVLERRRKGTHTDTHTRTHTN